MSAAADGLTYPSVMVATMALLVLATAASVPVTVAAYLAVAIGAVAIIGLERLRPHRIEWQPDRRAVVNDALFLVLIQMVVPVLVSGLAVFALGTLGRDLDLSIRSWWPHDAPVVLQVILMLVIADALRYWLHRAFHRFPTMWRFHAVHHSPQRLYWLNVGRFHPLEKLGQLVFDSLPFVLVGVGNSVLAGYFVFYAMNGFFQHSNCRVRLGPLNHLVSGPELHRWHHSTVIAESDTNFGNNLIIWDHLFGTRYLPPAEEVGDLGLINRHYPDRFVDQMTTPFTPDLDKVTGS